MKQMPEEGEKFASVDATWREIMTATHEAPAVVPIARDVSRLTRLVECNALLDEIQKGLAAYLEKKRLFFPRYVCVHAAAPSNAQVLGVNCGHTLRSRKCCGTVCIPYDR